MSSRRSNALFSKSKSASRHSLLDKLCPATISLRVLVAVLVVLVILDVFLVYCFYSCSGMKTEEAKRTRLHKLHRMLHHVGGKVLLSVITAIVFIMIIVVSAKYMGCDRV